MGTPGSGGNGLTAGGANNTIKIRNLAHLLQQLDELGQPISSNANTNSDDVRLSEMAPSGGGNNPDSLYGMGSLNSGSGSGGRPGSHHGSGGNLSMRNVSLSSQGQPVGTPVGSAGGPMYGGQAPSRVCNRHLQMTNNHHSMDSQLVEQDLAYLLGDAADPASYRTIRGVPGGGGGPRGQTIVPNGMISAQQQMRGYVQCLFSMNFALTVCYCRPSGRVSTLLNPYQTSSYFATLPPLSPSTTTSTTTSTAREGACDDEAEEYDYEENGSAFDSDLNADQNSFSNHNGSLSGSNCGGYQLTRSASEEALSVRTGLS